MNRNLEYKLVTFNKIFFTHFPHIFTGLYFFTFSARGQVEDSNYYYERVRSSQKMDAEERDSMPIVIDRSRNRYYFRPGNNYLNDEWE